MKTDPEEPVNVDEEPSPLLSGPLTRRAMLGRIGGIVVATGLTSEALAQDGSDADFENDPVFQMPRRSSEQENREKPLPPGYRSEGLPRTKHTSTRVPGEGILLAGGDFNGALSSAEFFEPRQERWRDAASMGTPRADHAAVLLRSGRVMVIGGFFRNALSSVEIYDPRMNKWSFAASMNVPRYGHTAARIGGDRVLVFGGNYDGALSSVEEYDVYEDTWTLL